MERLNPKNIRWRFLVFAILILAAMVLGSCGKKIEGTAEKETSDKEVIVIYTKNLTDVDCILDIETEELDTDVYLFYSEYAPFFKGQESKISFTEREIGRLKNSGYLQEISKDEYEFKFQYAIGPLILFSEEYPEEELEESDIGQGFINIYPKMPQFIKGEGKFIEFTVKGKYGEDVRVEWDGNNFNQVYP
jgi:hypothetical protein